MARTRFGFDPVSFCVGVIAGVTIVWLGMNFRLARVSGDAMAPAYVRGDVVLATAFGSGRLEPRRGEIELLYSPLQPDRMMIDRVIGVQGDTVRISGGRVYLNDRLFPDDRFVVDAQRGDSDWGPLVVPQGYAFVLGDNRLRSTDSRQLGFVPRRYLWGRVLTRLWPSH